MRPDRLLVQDLLDAIEEVLATTPSSRAEFGSNKFIQSHVLRYIQIIGEAAWRLSQNLKDRHPEIPWRNIAGMRHAIVHDYFEIDWDEVYNTAVRDVPALRRPIEAMLQSLPTEEDDL